MNERLDALLSARRDGALDAAESAELERLLAESESARRRALELERVDDALRELAGRAIPDERLERSFAVVERRLAASSGKGERDVRASTLRRPIGRRIGWGLAAAVAAGWAASVLLSRPGPEPTNDVLVAGGVAEDDLALLDIAEKEDLEVIGELDLLEFLADRDRSAGEPQG